AGGTESPGVRLDGVDLPGLLARAVHPYLVLDGVAARRVVLGRCLQPRTREALAGFTDLVGGLDLDAEMVHDRRLPRLALQQHELERGVGDGEVGVAGPELGRLRAEQLRVEVDRAFEVPDPQGELYSSHLVLLE